MATRYVTLKDSNGDTIYPQISTDSITNGSISHSKLKATTLFNGSQTTTIPLSDDATQYEYIEVFAQEMGGRKVYLKITTPAVGTKFALSGIFAGSSNTTLYVRTSTYEFTSATQISRTSDNAEFDIKASGTTITGVGSGNIIISRVVGYK